MVVQSAKMEVASQNVSLITNSGVLVIQYIGTIHAAKSKTGLRHVAGVKDAKTVFVWSVAGGMIGQISRVVNSIAASQMERNGVCCWHPLLWVHPVGALVILAMDLFADEQKQ